MEDDRFEDWERYPSIRSEEEVRYQKLAWYAAPFGSTGIGLVLLVAGIDMLRRLGRQFIRIAARLKLV